MASEYSAAYAFVRRNIGAETFRHIISGDWVVRILKMAVELIHGATGESSPVNLCVFNTQNADNFIFRALVLVCIFVEGNGCVIRLAMCPTEMRYVLCPTFSFF